MPKRTINYRLEHQERGLRYSAQSDFRRFVTMDYNLESYLGIVGVGVIQGWELQDAGGLSVEVLPGDGVIEGYYVESPYVVKQRSEMVAGDREVDVYRDQDGVPEPPLTPSERATYVAVVQLYDPSYNPTGSIENAFVKVVVPSSVALIDNSDNYVYARRPSGAIPYPKMDDFPELPGDPPNRADYSNYTSYQAALQAYNAKLDAIHEYHWNYDSSTGDPHENHFTEVEFISSLQYRKSSSLVLLGRVVTRNGSVFEIDTSQVDVLENMRSLIEEYATRYLVAHRHGGSAFFDPPAVRLETDIREAVLSNYNVESGRLTFRVLDKNETSTTLGHKHTYDIDSDGDGNTVGQEGSTNPHFHKIVSSVVQTQEASSLAVEDHIHELVSAANSSNSTWTSSSQYVVYVNDEIFGDETSSNVTAYPDSKQLVFSDGVSVAYKVYGTSFDAFNTRYSYTARANSVYRFMIELINDFNVTFTEQFTSADTTGTGSDEVVLSDIEVAENLLNNNPFLFFDDEGNAEGLGDLKSQSLAAESLLKNAGDKFTFTPNAADNITITLLEVRGTDKVELEILGDSEVTGVLRPESILYLKASKIARGEFDVERIPFISHVGRLEEEFLPVQYSLVSTDGARYEVVPSLTEVELGHSHRLLLNDTGSGATTDVLIGEDAVLYASDDEGNSYFIAHYHGVNEEVVGVAESVGLAGWVEAETGVNTASASHTHEVISPIGGDAKVVYTMKEDRLGNLYVGTSDGFLLVPASTGYEFTINGYHYYLQGSDLWTLLGLAKEDYESETDTNLRLDEDVYRPQVVLASEAIVNEGDSYLLIGPNIPDQNRDEIMIKMVGAIPVSNFGYTSSNTSSNVSSSAVEYDFNDTPVWSVALKSVTTPSAAYVASVDYTDILAVGSDLIAKNRGVETNPNLEWSAPVVPFSVGILRDILKSADGSYWVSSNNGVLVSRSYRDGDSFEIVNLPGGNPDIASILEGAPNEIYTASTAGIYKTTNGGKSWTQLFDVIGGFDRLVRDRTADVSNVVDGHYHILNVDMEGNGFLEESIGSGTPHVHQVSWWDIGTTLGHTHDIVVTLYAVDIEGDIYKSTDDGVSWTSFGTLPDGEYGVFDVAWGVLFVSKSDGLYKSSNGSQWTRVIEGQIFSSELTYDISYLLFGGDGVIYKTYDGTNFETAHSLGGYGSPILIRNGSREFFGYAYCNQTGTFHFDELQVTTDSVSALVDYSRWYAIEGPWSETKAYEIFIDNKRVLSTKRDEDKRAVYGYNFSVTPSEGLVDFFASSNVASNVSVYDLDIEVTDGTEFSSGDKILIQSNTTGVFVTVEAVAGNTIELTSRISTAFEAGASVMTIVPFGVDSSVIGNIYESILSSIGTFTHDELEDSLSYANDGRPFKLNDSYLSNLLQLTQAVRYSYPSINSEFKNSEFYDFHYSWSTSDPVYPYIGDYIDLLTSETFNQNLYDSDFVAKQAKSINDILIGYGPFAGKIFVATDIGIFWSRIESNYEGSWFFVSAIQMEVYDLTIFAGERLLAATDSGVYYTEDGDTWVLEESPAMLYPVYAFDLRWKDFDVTVVDAHRAHFASDSDADLGYITALSGTPYTVFEVNKGIRITGADEKDGTYIITAIDSGGSGFGSRLIVSPSFSGASSTKNDVVITMGAWWQQWDGDVNTANANLTNTLLVGGEENASFNNAESNWAWYSSDVDVSRYAVTAISSLSSGSALMATVGTLAGDPRNYLLKSDDVGKTWEEFRTFRQNSGVVLKSVISDANNLKVYVSFDVPSNREVASGIFDQERIIFYSPGTLNMIGSSRVVWNENIDGENSITVWGNDLAAVVEEGAIFVIQPSKINTMQQTSDGTVLFGTNRGVYTDVDTVANNSRPEGGILSPGVNGTVASIDINGRIISAGRAVDAVNSILSVELDQTVRQGSLSGKTLYVTDADPVEAYTITSNQSIAITDEVVLSTDIPESYVGKRFVIAGGQSVVYVNFDLPVIKDQFVGGSMYVSSGENDNLGKRYNIVGNGTNYVELQQRINPPSTLRGSETGTDDVIAGQSVRFVNKTGQVTIWATFDRELPDNYLAGLEYSQAIERESTNDAGDEIVTTMRINETIYASTQNSVILRGVNPLDFEAGQGFSVNGIQFQPLSGFNHKLTSVESAHYHGLSLVNAFITGKVGSFASHNDSFVTINVTDTDNFSTAIVQASGDLLNDASIVFTNDGSYNLRYVSRVESHTASTITVRLVSADYWDFDASDEIKISSGWKWKIDARNYGYTEGTFYSDFVVLGTKITSDIDIGDQEISVESTSGISVNDEVRIQDDTLSEETNYVASVVDGTTLTLRNEVGRIFLVDRNSQMKVVRDSFSNTHVHQVRNNEVFPVVVESYLNRGYPAEHAHRCLSYIADVSAILEKGSSLVAAGSGSILYESFDDGTNWNVAADLNDYREGDPEEIEGISSATVNSGNIIAGTTNGNVFVQGVNGALPIVKIRT